MALTASVAKYKLNPVELESAPKLSQLFADHVEGGLAPLLQAMRFSTDALIRKFLKLYDEASAEDRWILPWEGFCLVAGIDPTAFIGPVMLSIQSTSALKVKLKLFSNHPDTVAARIENAKQPWGVKDRDAIDMELGLLASPKGATIINKQIIQQGEQGDSDADTKTDVDFDFAFPFLADTQKTVKRLPPSRRSDDRELDDRDDA